jgi:hypothetical protein
MDTNSTALASLTATYTDSDISDDEGEVHEKEQPGSNKPNDDVSPFKQPSDILGPERNSSPLVSSNSQQLSKKEEQKTTSATKTVSQLVSYNVEPDKEEEGYSPSSDYDMDTFVFDETDKAPCDETSLSRSVLNMAPDDIKLPPEPLGRCSNNLQEKIARYNQKKQREGLDMNVIIQRKKGFRNPSIYEKLISYCGIDELGTNYPPEIYDPHMWGPQSYYEELSKVQMAEINKRQKEKTKVEFVSGTAKKPADLTGGVTDETKKRKSKWDMGAGNHPLPIPVIIKPTGLLSTAPGVVTVTTAASGNKPTVISAFGTISKKPKS